MSKEKQKPAWLERAEAEQKELREGLKKIGAALNNANVRCEIDPADSQDMLVQEAAMATYNQALANRIKRNGGTVCE